MALKEISLRKAKNCTVTDDFYRSRWAAEAVYTIESLKDVNNVTFGFPTPESKYEYQTADGLESIKYSTVLNFKTSINGKNIAVKKKELHNIPNSYHSNEKYPGFTWQASFKTGEKYQLKSSYEVGLMYNGDYFENDKPGYQSVVHKNQKIWFGRDQEGVTALDKALHPGSIDYILSPLKLWAAPPPKKISIELVFPKHIPTIFAVPYYPYPNCVGKNELYFEFLEELPDSEFRVSYPTQIQNVPGDEYYKSRITTLKQWNNFLSQMGPKTPGFTCQFKKFIQSTATDEALKTQLNNLACVQKCGER